MIGFIIGLLILMGGGGGSSKRRYGKLIKVRGFPKNHKVKLFRVVLSTQRTDYVVTNDLAQDDTQAIKEVCGKSKEN